MVSAIGAVAIVLAALAVLGTSRTVEAQAGEWRLGGRILTLDMNAETDPSFDNGPLIAFDGDLGLSVHTTHFLTETLALELTLASARHDVSTLGGSLGDLDLGTAWFTHSTATLQYRLSLMGPWQPYLGLGIGGTLVHNSTTSEAARVFDVYGISSDVVTGIVGQAGVAYRHGRRWIVSLDVKCGDASGTLRIKGGDDETTARLDFETRPWMIGLGAAYRF